MEKIKQILKRFTLRKQEKGICIECFKPSIIRGGGKWIEPLMCDDCKKESQKHPERYYN